MKIEKINDSLYVLEDFIPPLWQDIIEGYFRFDAPWNPVYNVAFDPSDENALKHAENHLVPEDPYTWDYFDHNFAEQYLC